MAKEIEQTPWQEQAKAAGWKPPGVSTGESIVFGQKMAKVLLDSSSSNAFFFVQQAYGDIDWQEARHILEKVLAESQEVKA